MLDKHRQEISRVVKQHCKYSYAVVNDDHMTFDLYTCLKKGYEKDLLEHLLGHYIPLAWKFRISNNVSPLKTMLVHKHSVRINGYYSKL